MVVEFALNTLKYTKTNMIQYSYPLFLKQKQDTQRLTVKVMTLWSKRIQ